MTAPRAREQADPPSPPYRLPPRRGGRPSSQTVSAAARPAGFARLAGARRGFHRPARALAAAALLALAGALALPATAEAQTATTLVSNVGHGTGHVLGASTEHSQQFTTGSNPSGYTLTAVDVVPNSAASATSTPFTARVCETDASGFPTSDCTALTVSVPYDAGTVSLSAPASTTLTQGKTYALVFGGTRDLENTLSDDEDMGSQPEWSIGNQYDWYSEGDGTWRTGNNGRSLLIAIKGTAVGGSTPSTDATLNGLAVNDGSTDLMLNPGFAPDEDTYTASVGNTVAEVTVTPTTTDDGATIAWLDASDMTLADADTLVTGQQVTMVDGANVITVRGDGRGRHHRTGLHGDGEPGGGGHYRANARKWEQRWH